MKKDQAVLILGGGYAGARLGQDLSKAGFTSVTLVDRKAYFENTYAMLRAVTDPALGVRARMEYADLLGAGFRQGEVTSLGPDHATLADGTTLPFDTAIVATGSSYPTLPIAKSSEALSLDAREGEIASEHERLRAAQNVLIVGGGTVGVELAGEIAAAFPDKSVTVADGSDRLLATLKPKADRVARQKLDELGVKVMTNTRLSPGDATYDAADIVYTCIGLVPNTGFMSDHFAGTLDPSGRIKVDAMFRVEGAPNIYAIGDAATLPPVKFGYVADMQAQLLAKNFIAQAEGKPGKSFKAPGIMSLVPIGPKAGLVQMPFGVTTMRAMVNMKNKDLFITRAFANLGVKR